MAQDIRFGTSYFGNRMLRHVKTDMRELADQGFNYVLLTFSEFDLQFHRENMADMVRVAREAGLEVHLSPWGSGMFSVENLTRILWPGITTTPVRCLMTDGRFPWHVRTPRRFGISCWNGWRRLSHVNPMPFSGMNRIFTNRDFFQV